MNLDLTLINKNKSLLLFCIPLGLCYICGIENKGDHYQKELNFIVKGI
jgi:hypothetical protein